jgi:deoxyribodipyrimidine photolyase-related protein
MTADGAAGPPGRGDPALQEFPARSPGTRRWCFADQLGGHFLDAPDQPVLLVESRAVFRRRRFHRQKAHLLLSALRHRATELGDRAIFLRTATYREALDQLPAGEALSVCDPTSRPAREFVREQAAQGLLDVLPARGYAVTEAQFDAWAQRRGHRRLLLEDFYRDVRRLHGLLVGPDGEPEGGRWNYDQDNRQPPPRRARLLADATGVPEPWWPVEDDLDAEVREELDRWEKDAGVEFVGEDRPRRFAVTRQEALAALEWFVAAAPVVRRPRPGRRGARELPAARAAGGA